jgi:hypothetical protein
MARFDSSQGLAFAALGLATVWTVFSWTGCSTDSNTGETNPTTTHTGGHTTTTTSQGAGGTGGTTTSSSTTTSAGANGGGGAGGTGGGWPTCDTKPDGVETDTIVQVWQQHDTATEAPVWVPNVIVTSISYGACSPNYACQLSLQQDETYASLGAAAHQAIKLYVSANTAFHFTGIGVGDRVDVYANAVRSDYNGGNELELLVNTMYPGCAKKVGSANPVPVPGVLLSDLTVNAFEYTIGPVLVQVQNVTGKPALPAETFGLWPTGQWVDAGIEEMVSLSPYCISGGQFSGLTQGVNTNFDYVQGVFEIFIPDHDGGAATKYKEICARAMTDLPVL